MKTLTNIIIASGFIMGSFLSSNAFASSSSDSYVSESSQRIEQYRQAVSASTVLNYGDILLQRSTVANKLKSSANPADNARYSEALNLYKTAEHAFQMGDEQQAKKLALESIRIIARAVPQYYQTAKAEN